MSTLIVETVTTPDTNTDLTINPNGTGKTVVDGDLTVDTSTLHVDATNNRVGIGSASPDHTLTVSASSAPVFEMEQTSGGPFKANLVLNGNDLEVRGSSGNIEFFTGSDDGASSTERMRIRSNGKVGINTTDISSTLEVVPRDSSPTIETHSNSTATHNHLQFRNSSGTEVGTISCTTTATSFNTGSDHRLKENVADMTGAIVRVKQLTPKRFNFIADTDDTTVDGFLAHEAQTVVPEAVTGTHNEVDDDGNPIYQGIDQAKLVPVLTGALQEAIAKIEALETRVAALEAN